jgi:hypothetical protein
VDKISRCFQTGEIWEDTFLLSGRDGIYRLLLSRAVPIRDRKLEGTHRVLSQLKGVFMLAKTFLKMPNGLHDKMRRRKRST